jgi:hypothetical protein
MIDRLDTSRNLIIPVFEVRSIGIEENFYILLERSIAARSFGSAYSPKTYLTEASTSRILLGESIPTGLSGKRLGSKERT